MFTFDLIMSLGSADEHFVAFSDEIKNPDIEPIRRKVINLQSDLKVEMKRAKTSEEFQVWFLCMFSHS